MPLNRAIALPSRYLAHDAPPQMYEGYGGANGPIATPGRQDALENGGPYEHPNFNIPPTDGAWGPIRQFVPAFNWSDRVRIPSSSTPLYGVNAILRVRQFVDTASDFLNRAMPRTNDTNWTRNTVADIPGFASPIPHFRHWISYTLYHGYGSDRLYSDYWKPEATPTDQSTARSKQLSGMGYRQVKPYFPKLTEWQLLPTRPLEVLK